MAPPLFSGASRAPSTSGGSVSTGSPSTLMPERMSIPNPPALDRISNTPSSRGSDVSVTTIQGSKIGQTNDANAVPGRTAAFTAANNASGIASTTAADQAANLAAVEARKKGVLGCIGRSTINSASQKPCDPCETVDCLTKLLTGNLLDQDAKKLLCDTMNNTEKALKRQIDSAGDALLNAAQNLTSARALQAPLNTLSSFLNKLDPGAVAKCFGAQNVIDNVNRQVKKVNKIIKDAEKGVHDKLAEKFNKATEAAQQFGVAPSMCDSKGAPASIRSLV